MRSAVTGTPKPITAVIPSGMSALTWAFASGECGSESWGGVTSAAIAGNIQAFLDAGKKYIVSTGGLNGAFTCGSDASFDKFISTYYSANLIGIDFDIEGGVDQAQITELVKRIKVAQASYPSLRFSFTLATLGSTGSGSQLSFLGNWVLEAIQTVGLNWNNVFINLMAMDYGSGSSACVVGSSGKCDMGASAIAAAESMHNFFKVPYSSIELTPMIGGNDVQSNVFTLDDVATVSSYALSKGLGGMHIWSFDRDTDCAAGPASPVCNSYGVAGSLGFSNAFINALASSVDKVSLSPKMLGDQCSDQGLDCPHGCCGYGWYWGCCNEP